MVETHEHPCEGKDLARYGDDFHPRRKQLLYLVELGEIELGSDIPWKALEVLPGFDKACVFEVPCFIVARLGRIFKHHLTNNARDGGFLCDLAGTHHAHRDGDKIVSCSSPELDLSGKVFRCDFAAEKLALYGVLDQHFAKGHSVRLFMPDGLSNALEIRLHPIVLHS